MRKLLNQIKDRHKFDYCLRFYREHVSDSKFLERKIHTLILDTENEYQKIKDDEKKRIEEEKKRVEEENIRDLRKRNVYKKKFDDIKNTFFSDRAIELFDLDKNKTINENSKVIDTKDTMISWKQKHSKRL